MEKEISRIKLLRQQKGMSQKAFAEYLGIPLRTIEEWEGARRTPPEYVIDLIQFKVEHDSN